MRKNYRLTEDYYISFGLMPAREDRTETWVLHHIDEDMIHNDPERHDEYRIEDVVPMTLSDHSKYHNSGEKNAFFGLSRPQETRDKISQSKIGKPNWSKGLTKETDERVAKRGRKGIVPVSKGKHWYNNGTIELFSIECPEGFTQGRLPNVVDKMSKTKKKASIKTRGSTGMHWYTNGVDSIQSFECPEGYWPGRVCKK